MTRVQHHKADDTEADERFDASQPTEATPGGDSAAPSEDTQLLGAADAQDSENSEAADAKNTESSEPAKEYDATEAETTQTATAKRRVNWSRVLIYKVLPILALALAVAAGYLKWQDSSARIADIAVMESNQAAKDSTIALLSYRPDTAERDLGAARDRLTGTFRESYTQLTRDVVIPGAKEKQISSTATVPAIASVQATGNHAVVLEFINQTVVIDGSAPTDSASTVRVTLDKIGGRWLISGFDPV
jgi:Mce-associated membrane protein